MGNVLPFWVYIVNYGIRVALLACSVDHNLILFVYTLQKLFKVRPKVKTGLKMLFFWAYWEDFSGARICHI